MTTLVVEHTDSATRFGFRFLQTRSIASASKDGTIRLWDVATGQPLKTFNGSSATKAFNSVAFSPDGTVVAGASDDENIYLWNVATGQLTQTLGGTNTMLSVAFSSDGKTVAAGNSDKQRLSLECGERQAGLENLYQQL
jgi:WD40 repeat protein